MLKKIGFSLLLGFSIFFFALPVLAGDPSYGLKKAAQNAEYKTSQASVYSIVGTVIQTILAITGFIFFGLLTYSGIRWMTARGNEEFITKAKNNVMSTITGLIIITVAYALTTLILGLLNA